MESRRYYTVSEFRQIAAIGTTKVYQLLAEGRLAAVKLDGRTLLCAASADRFLKDLPRASFATGQKSRTASEVRRAHG